MIHVIDEMHLNDFKEVRCPKGKDLFNRIIKSSPDPNFEGSDEPIDMFGDKVSQLEDLYAYDAWHESRNNSDNSYSAPDSSSDDTKRSEVSEEDEK